MDPDNAIPWGFVIIGGPVLLGLALAWAKLRNRGVNRDTDPGTPGDDPSKGMTGHDQAPARHEHHRTE